MESESLACTPAVILGGREGKKEGTRPPGLGPRAQRELLVVRAPPRRRAGPSRQWGESLLRGSGRVQSVSQRNPPGPAPRPRPRSAGVGVASPRLSCTLPRAARRAATWRRDSHQQHHEEDHRLPAARRQPQAGECLWLAGSAGLVGLDACPPLAGISLLRGSVSPPLGRVIVQAFLPSQCG